MFFLLAGFVQSCALYSTTYIDPNKSFMLGQGKHQGYSADIRNAGQNGVEVFTIAETGDSTSLGVLRPNEKKNYAVPANTLVRFKNLSSVLGATIQIELRGDTNLSMGYKENK